MEVQLELHEMRDLFNDLKGRVMAHYATSPDSKGMKSIIEAIIKMELYLNADFRGLWSLERAAAKANTAPEQADMSYFS
jgi:hypothetical protein